MEQQKSTELINYLNSIGFSGQRLEDRLLDFLATKPLHFKTTHQVGIREATMLYELHFNWEPQFLSYRLSNYKATLRNQVLIPHDSLAGLDIAALERNMDSFDWERYFNNSHYDQTGNAEIFAEDINLRLNRMADQYGQKGEDLRDLLIYKYWPREAYHQYGKRRDLPQQYEKSLEFSASENGICSAELAFYHVSGVVSDLYEQICASGIAEFTTLDLYREIEKQLQSTPEHFSIKHVHVDQDAFGDFEIPVYPLGNRFVAEEYTIKHTPFPAVQHGTFNGIDTAALDADMQKISWKTDVFFFHNEADVLIREGPGHLIEQLEQLQKDEQGKFIADLLTIKYWADSELMENLITADAWKLLETLPGKTVTFPVDIPTAVAWNLLSERAAKEEIIYRFATDTGNWVSLDPGNSGDSKQADLVINARGFTHDDLLACLQQLPIKNVHAFWAVDYSLERGDIASVTLNNGKEVLLQANPTRRTIDVFTPQMQLIPVNLHFDLNWTPAIVLNQAMKVNDERMQKPHGFRNRNLPIRKGRKPGL